MQKLITLCSKKLDQIKCPQKLMSENSKAKIFEKLRMGKAWRFVKNCISIDRKICIPTSILLESEKLLRKTKDKPYHKWQVLGLIAWKIRTLRLC